MSTYQQIPSTRQTTAAEYERELLDSPPLPPLPRTRVQDGRNAILAVTQRCLRALEKAGRNPWNDNRNFLVRDSAGNVKAEARKVVNEFRNPKTGRLAQFRPIKNDRALPSVMSRERQKLLAIAGAYFADSGHKDFRYAVITGGPTCGVNDIKERIRKVRNKIAAFSAWAQRAFEAYDFEIVLVTFEITCSPVALPQKHLLYHPHANVVYRVNRLPRDKWDRLMDGLRKYFPDHHKEAGRIRCISAVLKYIMKLSDISNVLDHGKFVDFHDQLFRLSTIQLLGSLRAYRKQLNSKGLKVCRDPKRWGHFVIKSKETRPRPSGPRVWNRIPSEIPLGEIVLRLDDGTYGRTALVMKVLPKPSSLPRLQYTYSSLTFHFPSVLDSRLPIQAWPAIWAFRPQQSAPLTVAPTFRQAALGIFEKASPPETPFHFLMHGSLRPAWASSN